jgi:hypothetical protein
LFLLCVSLYSIRVIIIHSTAHLTVSNNSLTGMIPSEIALLMNLSELSIVWLLVVTVDFVACFIVLNTCRHFSF